MDAATLYGRMEANLFAWWEGLARSSPHARLVRFAGITAALFPAPGERDVFNNAVASRPAPPTAAAVAELAALYAAHGVDLWQLWVHEDDRATGRVAEAAGLVVDTTTLAMAMELATAALDVPPGPVILRDPDVPDMRGLLDNAETLVPQLRTCGASLYALLHEGQPASCAVSFEHAGDCGIYIVETVERFRRRGLARALVSQALRDACGRGCTSASLQSTAMGERLYASLGFRPLGRYVEWQHRGQGPEGDETADHDHQPGGAAV
jgi:GNAT superfamily N-acetyltransferase